MILSALDDVRLITFPSYRADNGTLVVFEGAWGEKQLEHVPFALARVFTIFAETPTVRGLHAHRQCQQLLVCVAGKCLVKCSDGHDWLSIELTGQEQGLLLPPGIWAEEHMDAASGLMVLCDRPFDEEDYIRDFSDFVNQRRLTPA